jgi:hypothetical protein
MLLYYFWIWGVYALATVICAAACIWGGWPERVCGATLWIAWTLSLLVESHDGNGPGNQIVLIDSVCLVIFTALSLKARHIWTLLVAASQLDDVMSHFTAKMLHYALWSYAMVTGLWGGQLILVCLLIATINHKRRLRRATALRTPGLAN